MTSARATAYLTPGAPGLAALSDGSRLAGKSSIAPLSSGAAAGIGGNVAGVVPRRIGYSNGSTVAAVAPRAAVAGTATGTSAATISAAAAVAETARIAITRSAISASSAVSAIASAATVAAGATVTTGSTFRRQVVWRRVIRVRNIERNGSSVSAVTGRGATYAVDAAHSRLTGSAIAAIDTAEAGSRSPVEAPRSVSTVRAGHARVSIASRSTVVTLRPERA